MSKVYINLIDQKEPTLDFKALKNEKIEFNKDNQDYSKKIIEADLSEVKLHKEYLKKNLKKNFFN